MERKDILSFSKLNSLWLRYFVLIVLIGSYAIGFSQLSINFDNGSLSNPAWVGNVSNFIVNTAGQLQLNAPAAGESSLFTKYKVPADSIQMDFYFKLQFSPSNDNFGKIYLFTDNIDETVANGYYMRIGENGSADALQIWKLTNGVASMLAAGSMGAVSADPADGRVSMKIYRDGYWSVSVDYTGNNLFQEDISFFDPSYTFQDSTYFGVYCKYTSSRTDKFFYDDISINTVERDTIAPSVLAAEIIDQNRLVLTFSEPLEETSANILSNYVVDNGIGSPDQISFTVNNPNQVLAIFNTKPIASGIPYTIQVVGVKDKSNNMSNSSIGFVFATSPDVGDLILTEVLTDPYSGGDDFIEIYNTSNKFLKLNGLIVRNAQKNESKVITTDAILLPNEYVAITKSIDFLIANYNPPADARFIAATIPTMNVDGANITLITLKNNEEIILDAFDYSVDYHFSFIDETKGVSLERISLTSTTNDPNNWHSASKEVFFATPGYKNSNNVSGTSSTNVGIEPNTKVISPNGDGVDDFVLLNYTMDKPGYLATIKIYDADGFPLLDLANNYLLGTEGAIKWDGIDMEGNRMRIGMYIIFARLFHPDGDVIESKNVVVVAGDL